MSNGEPLRIERKSVTVPIESIEFSDERINHCEAVIRQQINRRLDFQTNRAFYGDRFVLNAMIDAYDRRVAKEGGGE